MNRRDKALFQESRPRRPLNNSSLFKKERIGRRKRRSENDKRNNNSSWGKTLEGQLTETRTHQRAVAAAVAAEDVLAEAVANHRTVSRVAIVRTARVTILSVRGALMVLRETTLLGTSTEPSEKRQNAGMTTVEKGTPAGE